MLGMRGMLHLQACMGGALGGERVHTVTDTMQQLGPTLFHPHESRCTLPRISFRAWAYFLLALGPSSTLFVHWHCLVSCSRM